MQNDLLASLAQLPDGVLVARMKALIARELDVTAEIVAHLAELDTRDLYIREGYGSLYVYCRDALGLSEWEAYNRIEVARSARRFPVILEMLADGSLSLTAARLLGPHLTADNHREVLGSASGKPKAEVAKIVARLSPRPDVAFSVRKIPKPAAGRVAGPAVETSEPALAASPPGHPLATPVTDPFSPSLVLATSAPPEIGAAVGDVVLSTCAAAVRPAPDPARVAPLSPDRYKLQVTISGETLERLRLAKDMLGHAIPSGDDAAVLDRALVALLAELAKKKFADARAPRPPRSGNLEPGAEIGSPRPSVAAGPGGPSAAMRPVPARKPSAAVKRAVWVRDLGRCAFIGAGGHRCNERRFVEFHHVDPYILGGEATVDGMQLRCRRHNDYEGRLYFGKRRAALELVPEQVRSSVSPSPRTTRCGPDQRAQR